MILREMRNYFGRIENCGYTLKVNGWVLTIGCKKQACPKCGGINHSIHKNRIHSVERRISDSTFLSTRHIVFTLPSELRREHFLTRDSLTSLFGIVKRNIEKYFGVFVRVKDQAKGKIVYRLDKPVMAALQLFGEDHTYNPHVHVMIFEGDSHSLRIGGDKLTAIKKSYQKALSSLLKQRIEVVNVKYNYYLSPRRVSHGVWYLTRCLDPNLFREMEEAEDTELLRFLIVSLKRFHFVRFWGLLSNCKYKQQRTRRRAA